MLVYLSQYQGSVGIFSNRNSSVQPKVSHLRYLSDNINNLATGSLILLNKIGLVFTLLNLMFVFKGNASKHEKKSSSFGPYFPHSSHVTCLVGFISF